MNAAEPFRVWQSGDWTILHVTDGSGTQTTSSLTRDQARMLSWKLRNSPRQAPEMPHWNGIGKYSPCISFDAGALTVNGGGFSDSGGSGFFAFKEDELEFEQDDGPVYRWISVSNSDLLHLRDQLNKLFPPAIDDLTAAAPQLYDGCNALLGLVQLLLGRDDLTDELREVLSTNHRIAEAEAATAKARGES